MVADLGTEVNVVEREIGGTHPPAGPAVEVHGRSQPDGDDPVFENVGDHDIQRFEHSRL